MGSRKGSECKLGDCEIAIERSQLTEVEMCATADVRENLVAGHSVILAPGGIGIKNLNFLLSVVC